MTHDDLSMDKAFCLHCKHLSSAQLHICPVCNEPLRQRKKNSISRTWALSLAALCFFIPANIFPIMKTLSITTYENNTILDGVFYFYKNGEFFVGTVVFIASIFIPAVKMLVLFFLLLSVKIGSRWRREEKNSLYKAIHLIGRWSMLDIFVIGLMVSLVQFGEIAVVTTGYAAPSFAAMVILTLLATESFDTRLLWDEKGKK
ncbi:MAG: paraquat-inducible protein A [Campylobacterales bacterium]|nr:paraquat-inducible protein A [Campylobacterales bacterium]